MIIYHGDPSRKRMEIVRERAPSYEHRIEWQAGRVGRLEERYMIDNGAFMAWKNGEEWDPDPFIKALNNIEKKMPLEPDFVVLPDIVGGGYESLRRSVLWADRVDYSKLIPIQDGMDVDTVIGVAKNLGLKGIFIGGSWDWKFKNSDGIVSAAHKEGFWVHMGRPRNILWAESLGVESVDTTSFIRNQAWDRLQAIEEQTTLI